MYDLYDYIRSYIIMYIIYNTYYMYYNIYNMNIIV